MVRNEAESILLHQLNALTVSASNDNIPARPLRAAPGWDLLLPSPCLGFEGLAVVCIAAGCCPAAQEASTQLHLPLQPPPQPLLCLHPPACAGAEYKWGFLSIHRHYLQEPLWTPLV